MRRCQRSRPLRERHAGSSRCSRYASNRKGPMTASERLLSPGIARSAAAAAMAEGRKVGLVVAAEMGAVRRTEMAEAFIADALGNLADRRPAHDETARP